MSYSPSVFLHLQSPCSNTPAFDKRRHHPSAEPDDELNQAAKAGQLENIQDSVPWGPGWGNTALNGWQNSPKKHSSAQDAQPQTPSFWNTFLKQKLSVQNRVITLHGPLCCWRHCQQSIISQRAQRLCRDCHAKWDFSPLYIIIHLQWMNDFPVALLMGSVSSPH